MIGKIRKETDMKWLDDILSKLDKMISKICQSPKQHRNLRHAAILSDSLLKSMKRLVETRFIRYMVGSIDAVLTNAYILDLMWQDQAAEGDNEIRGHLKNLVSPLFLPTLLVLADVFSQSAFASETAQSDIYPLWDQWRSQPDIWSCKCKFFFVYRPYKESISKEMNNDNDLNSHLHDQMSGWLRYCVGRHSQYRQIH